MPRLPALLLAVLLPLALGADTRVFRDLSPAEQVQVMRSEARVALVIGNGAYSGAAGLQNPPGDAQAVAEALRAVGFTVTYQRDLGAIAMKQALAAFGRQLEEGGVGLFYYAGHGIQYGGTNYLVPVDAQLARPDDLEIYGIPAEAVLAKMENAGNRVNIVILDACRNDPFSRGSGGLAMMDAKGTFLAYASGAGRVATDEGVYARALTRHLRAPGAKIEDVFKDVGADVEEATHGAQSPWVGSNMRGNFYFVLPDDTGDTESPAPTPLPPPRPSDTLLADHGIDMLRISSGSFTMGSPASETGRDSDETQHVVRLSRPFLLADKEVTQGLYEAVMGENPSAIRQRWWGGEAHGACSDWGVGDDLPVHCVDWYDAVRFCNRLSEREGLTPAYTVRGDDVTWDRAADGYRLPTEAEWEYAAKAGGDSVYAGTSDAGSVCRYGNVRNASTNKKYNETNEVFACDDGYPALAPVGRFQANAWGLRDMTGNVWEWVWDWYGDYPPGAVTDPVGPSVGKTVEYTGYKGPARVIRGGSWAGGPRYVRAAIRYRNEPGRRDSNLGFRLSRSSP